MQQRPLHIVILAAGKGSRMRSESPKVLHKVAGKSLLAHVVDCALTLDPERVHIVVGHGKDQVVDSMRTHAVADRFNWVSQEEQLGTGHAVSIAIPSINDDANVMMLTADVPLVKSETLATMLEATSSHPLVLLTALVENPFGLGRITRDSSGAVNGIVEEKDATDTQRQISEINSGIVCARKAELTQWLDKIDRNNAQQEYYLTDIVGLAAADGSPIATVHPDDNAEITGVNSRSQLAQVERHAQRLRAEQLMAGGVTLRDPERVDIRGDVSIGSDSIIDINVVIEGNTTIGNGVTIAPNCVIKNSRIADNVSIHPNTVIEGADIGPEVNIGPFARIRPGTQLAAEVRIGNFVETKNAQLSHGAKVNHLSYVGDASVGTNTNIGAGVITCNYDGAHKHHTRIGNDVFVGSDSQLVAPVTIGDGATVGAGSTITNNVGEQQLAISRSRQRHIDGWQRPVKDKT